MIIGLVQITEPIQACVNLPYTAGVLQTYVQAFAGQPQEYTFLPPLFLREPLAQAVHKLKDADLVGFSTYLWNLNYSLALAQALKAQRPQVLIVFGGPQVPDQAAEFLAAHPFVDLCVHGEGEQTFLQLVESWPQSHDFSALRGVSYRDAQGTCVSQPKGPRINDLSTVPSPYTSGYFEAILQAYPRMKWAATWESNRGCPFSCSFCDWGSALQSKVYRFSEQRIAAEITWLAQHQIETVYCCDANFGILPRDLEIARQWVAAHQTHAYPKLIYTQMTKNRPDRAYESLSILHAAGLHNSATLSMQSVSPLALQAIRRENISVGVYQELLQQFVAAGIPTYTDILIGLPGESWESFVEGVESLLNQGQHQEIRFGNVYLLPNAELSDPVYRKQHGVVSVSMPYVSPLTHIEAPIDGILETQEMVVATNTLPQTDWQRARILAWMTQILYFGRTLQIPLLLLHHFTGLSHRDLLLAFLAPVHPFPTPVLNQIQNFLQQRTEIMLAGQPEYVAGQDPTNGLPVWLPVQTAVLNTLLYGPQLPAFLAEARQILLHLLQSQGRALPNADPVWLDQALELSQALFKTHHPQFKSFTLTQNYNLWEGYQAILKGEAVELKKGQWWVTHLPDAQQHYQTLAHEEALEALL